MIIDFEFLKIPDDDHARDLVYRGLTDLRIYKISESVSTSKTISTFSVDVFGGPIAEVVVEGYSINKEDVEIVKNLCLVKYGGGG